jgi:hypothetical protein
VCKRECMHLKEDKFRPGCMQLKDEVSVVLRGGLSIPPNPP